MDNVVIKELESSLYSLAYYKYNALYSTNSYTEQIQSLEYKIGTLLELCLHLNIPFELITQSYNDYQIDAKDQLTFKELTKWFYNILILLI